MTKRKGIVIGLKEKPMQMHATRRTYLTNFWREKGVLTDNKMSFFINEIWKFRCKLVKGQRFRIGSHVVIRPNEDIGNDDHVWTWEVKIEDFFVHECEGILEVFLLVDIFSNAC